MSVVRVRSEHARNGIVGPVWRTLFEEFPTRFMVGTDTFTPERWFYVVAHAAWSRQWLNDLPAEIRARSARDNAQTLREDQIADLLAFLQTLSSNN